MRIHPLRSLSAKLFYLTSALVLLTLAGNSWQNATMFNDFIERQIKENALAETREIASGISRVMGHWRDELATAARLFGRGRTAEERRGELLAFLDDHKEFVAVQILRRASASDDSAKSTWVVEESVFRSSDPDSSVPSATAPEAELQQLQATLPRQATELANDSLPDDRGSGEAPRGLVNDLENATKLPLFALILPYSAALPGTHEGKENFAAVLTIWKKPLVDALPAIEHRLTVLVDDGGRIFATGRLGNEGSAGGLLAKLASVPGGEEGLKTYRDDLGEEWLAASVPLPGKGLAVASARSARSQYLATSTIIKRSALWGWSFVLVAVLASFFAASSVTASLRAVTQATQEIASGNLKAQVHSRGRDEVAVLGASVAHMANQIEHLLEDRLTKDRLAKELETASLVQATFFPNGEASTEGAVGADAGRPITVHGFFQPASECGGDWWGKFPTHDGGMMLCIGDVTGHGVPAALVTAMAYSSCMTSGENYVRHGWPVSPSELLRSMNALLYRALGGKIVMTFFAAHFDFSRGIVTYANAGHNFPILLPKDPAADERQDGRAFKPVILFNSGNPLGLEADPVYQEKTLPIKAGDKFLLYTDGLIECQAPDGAPWNKRGMMETAKKSWTEGGAILHERMREAAFAHFAGRPLEDDVTFVVAEICATWCARSKASEGAA